MIKINNQKI